MAYLCEALAVISYGRLKQFPLDWIYWFSTGVLFSSTINNWLMRNSIVTRDVIDIPFFDSINCYTLSNISIRFNLIRHVSAICLSKVHHSFQFLLQKPFYFALVTQENSGKNVYFIKFYLIDKVKFIDLSTINDIPNSDSFIWWLTPGTPDTYAIRYWLVAICD